MNIMKRLNQSIILAAASLLLVTSAASCLKEETPSEDNGGTTTMTAVASVGKSDDGTKSSIVSDSGSYAFERSLRNVTLFQFRDGVLDSSYYATGNGGTIYIDVTGDTGASYVFYALGNCGDLTDSHARGTSLRDFLSSTEIRYNDPVADIASGGIPMFCGGSTVSGGQWDGVPVTFSEGSSFALTFIRLTARFNFALDTHSLKYGTFEPTSLVLAQSPKCIVPFAAASAPSLASDFTSGDHSSSDDLTTLSSGLSVPFYMLENARGTLLPGNSDPWSKVPSNITSESGKCTYLELKGTYSDHSGGLKAEHTYRMYLGKDNRTNFDVLRNYESTLTLTLSDDGFLKGSWKVERDILSDTRTMSFEHATYEVPYDTPVMAKLVTSGNIGVSYALSQNLIDAGVSYDATTRTLSQSVKLDADVTGTLTATSWDQVLTATTQVKALKYEDKSDVIIGVKPMSINIYKGGTPGYFDYEYSGTTKTLEFQVPTVNSKLLYSIDTPSTKAAVYYSGEGRIAVWALNSTPVGTYTLEVYDPESGSKETATVNVLAKSVPESPVGLADIHVDRSGLHGTSSISGAMVHDPSCPLNHDLYYDVETYVALSDCPNWHSTTVPAGKAGVVSMSFKVGYNYSVNSSGQLVCPYLTPLTDYEVVEVNLVGDNGHIHEVTQMADPVYDTASGTVTLQGQFQDGALGCFEIKLVTKGNRVDNGVRTYLVDFYGNVLARREGEYYNDEKLSISYEYYDNGQDWLEFTANHNCKRNLYWINSKNNIDYLSPAVDSDNTYDLDIGGQFQEFTPSSAIRTDKVYAMDRRAVVIREDEFSFGFPSVDIIENTSYKNNINNYPTDLMWSNQLKVALYAGFKDVRLSFDFQDAYCYDDIDNPGYYDEYDQNDNFVRRIWLNNSTQDGSLTTSWSDNVLTGRTYHACGQDWEFINLKVPGITVSGQNSSSHKLTIRGSEWTWDE